MLGLSIIRLGGLSRPMRGIRRQLPPLNFIVLHYLYFIVTCLFAAIVFWASSTPAHSVSFIDSLFLTVSAMTLTGLNTVNLSTLNTFQQCILFILIIIGSAIFVSGFVVFVRRRAFERKFTSILHERKAKRFRPRNPSWPSLPYVHSTDRGMDSEPSFRGRTTQRSATQSGSHDLDCLNTDASSSSSMIVGEDQYKAIRTNGSKPNPSTPPPPELLRSDALHGSAGQSSNEAQPALARDDPFWSGRSRITFSPDTRFRATSEDDVLSHRPPRPRMSLVSLQGVGAAPGAALHTVVSRPSTNISRDGLPKSPEKSTQTYFPSSGFISRNSQFHGLTEAERQSLGGVEYQAIRFLSWLVPLYFVLWQLLSCLTLAAWVAHHRTDTARQNGLNPWWVGAFNAVSAFNNSGMSLLDANMTAFQDAFLMLITMSLLILAGNTAYPIFLRLIIWSMFKLMPDSGRWHSRRNTLRFLLDHPRRCYTNLFPARHTWWLLIAVVSLNAVDWAAFEILNIGNDTLYSMLPTNLRVIDGLFQAFAVRTGGFYVVPITSVRIPLQLLYVVMMYISVYPVVITMRNSNVYEERSLGIYADDPGFEEDESEETPRPRTIWSHLTGLRRRVTGVQDTKAYFVRQQIRAQLAHDVWWVVLAVFLIMIVESGQFESNPAVFSVFNVIFETVSAYGTVGISVGVPWQAYSFCGAWHTLSKLILCAVMLRGRHRGLPVAIDKAVLLPGENLGHAEEEDAMIRMERTTSRGLGEGVV